MSTEKTQLNVSLKDIKQLYKRVGYLILNTSRPAPKSAEQESTTEEKRDLNPLLKFLKNRKDRFVGQGQLTFGKTGIFTSQDSLMNTIDSFFNSKDFDASILFYSGYGNNKGGSLNFQTPVGDFEVGYIDLIKKWHQRTNPGKNKHLLILLDSSNAGSWIAKSLKNIDIGSVSIQSYSSFLDKKEKKDDTEFCTSDFFIDSIINANRKSDEPQINLEKPEYLIAKENISPVASGFKDIVLHKFGLNCYANSWSDFDPNNSSTCQDITYEIDVKVVQVNKKKKVVKESMKATVSNPEELNKPAAHVPATALVPAAPIKKKIIQIQIERIVPSEKDMNLFTYVLIRLSNSKMSIQAEIKNLKEKVYLSLIAENSEISSKSDGYAVIYLKNSSRNQYLGHYKNTYLANKEVYFELNQTNIKEIMKIISSISSQKTKPPLKKMNLNIVSIYNSIFECSNENLVAIRDLKSEYLSLDKLKEIIDSNANEIIDSISISGNIIKELSLTFGCVPENQTEEEKKTLEPSNLLYKLLKGSFKNNSCMLQTIFVDFGGLQRPSVECIEPLINLNNLTSLTFENIIFSQVTFTYFSIFISKTTKLKTLILLNFDYIKDFKDIDKEIDFYLTKPGVKARGELPDLYRPIANSGIEELTLYPLAETELSEIEVNLFSSSYLKKVKLFNYKIKLTVLNKLLQPIVSACNDTKLERLSISGIEFDISANKWQSCDHTQKLFETLKMISLTETKDIPFIMLNSIKNLTELILDSCNLMDSSFKELIVILNSCPNVTILDISNNFIGKQGFTALSQWMNTSNFKIKALMLNNMSLGKNVDLAISLKNNQILEHLEIGNCDVGNVKEYFDILHKDSSNNIKIISYSLNTISIEQFKMLMKNIKDKKGLIEVSLADLVDHADFEEDEDEDDNQEYVLRVSIDDLLSNKTLKKVDFSDTTGNYVLDCKTIGPELEYFNFLSENIDLLLENAEAINNSKLKTIIAYNEVFSDYNVTSLNKILLTYDYADYKYIDSAESKTQFITKYFDNLTSLDIDIDLEASEFEDLDVIKFYSNMLSRLTGLDEDPAITEFTPYFKKLKHIIGEYNDIPDLSECQDGTLSEVTLINPTIKSLTRLCSIDYIKRINIFDQNVFEEFDNKSKKELRICAEKDTDDLLDKLSEQEDDGISSDGLNDDSSLSFDHFLDDKESEYSEINEDQYFEKCSYEDDSYYKEAKKEFEEKKTEYENKYNKIYGSNEGEIGGDEDDEESDYDDDDDDDDYEDYEDSEDEDEDENSEEQANVSKPEAKIENEKKMEANLLKELKDLELALEDAMYQTKKDKYECDRDKHYDKWVEKMKIVFEEIKNKKEEEKAAVEISDDEANSKSKKNKGTKVVEEEEDNEDNEENQNQEEAEVEDESPKQKKNKKKPKVEKDEENEDDNDPEENNEVNIKKKAKQPKKAEIDDEDDNGQEEAEADEEEDIPIKEKSSKSKKSNKVADKKGYIMKSNKKTTFIKGINQYLLNNLDLIEEIDKSKVHLISRDSLRSHELNICLRFNGCFDKLDISNPKAFVRITTGFKNNNYAMKELIDKSAFDKTHTRIVSFNNTHFLSEVLSNSLIKMKFHNSIILELDSVNFADCAELLESWIKGNNIQLAAFILKNVALNSSDIYALKSILSSTSLIEVHLVNTFIDANESNILFKYLNPNLKTLNLSENYISNFFAYNLAKYLNTNKKLERLYLAKTRNSELIKYIIEHLNSLTVLDITESEKVSFEKRPPDTVVITSNWAGFKSFDVKYQIKNIEFNGFDFSKDKNLFTQFDISYSGSKLETIKLHSCYKEDTIMNILRLSVQCYSNITHLTINNTVFTFESTKHLIGILKSLKLVQHLNFAGNFMNDNQILPLLKQIRETPKSDDPQIKIHNLLTFDISENLLSESTIQFLICAIKSPEFSELTTFKAKSAFKKIGFNNASNFSSYLEATDILPLLVRDNESGLGRKRKLIVRPIS